MYVCMCVCFILCTDVYTYNMCIYVHCLKSVTCVCGNKPLPQMTMTYTLWGVHMTPLPKDWGQTENQICRGGRVFLTTHYLCRESDHDSYFGLMYYGFISLKYILCVYTIKGEVYV